MPLWYYCRTICALTASKKSKLDWTFFLQVSQDSGKLVRMLGDRLREQREKAGWSQAELAEQSGVGQSYLSKLERGEATCPSWRTVRALEDALGIKHGTLTRGLSAR